MKTSFKDNILNGVILACIFSVILSPIYINYKNGKNGEYVVDMIRIGKSVDFRCDNGIIISFLKNMFIEKEYKGEYVKYEIVKSNVLNYGVRDKELTLLLKLADYKNGTKNLEDEIESIEKWYYHFKDGSLKDLYQKHRYLGHNFSDEDLPEYFTDRDIMLLTEWTLSTNGQIDFDPSSTGDKFRIEKLLGKNVYD